MLQVVRGLAPGAPASLPDNDTELASLYGYGRVVKEWRKGSGRCSDRLREVLGRPPVPRRHCKKALSAFAATERHAFNRYQDRLRKENKAREKEKPMFGIRALRQWKPALPHGIPFPLERFPPEFHRKTLRGNGEGTERNLLPFLTERAAVPRKPAADVTGKRL